MLARCCESRNQRSNPSHMKSYKQNTCIVNIQKLSFRKELRQYSSTRSSKYNKPSQKYIYSCKISYTYVAVGCHKELGKSSKCRKSYALKQPQSVACITCIDPLLNKKASQDTVLVLGPTRMAVTIITQFEHNLNRIRGTLRSCFDCLV